MSIWFAKLTGKGNSPLFDSIALLLNACGSVGLTLPDTRTISHKASPCLLYHVFKAWCSVTVLLEGA